MKKYLLLVAFVVFALVAAGCQSSDNTAAPTEEPSTPQAEAPKPVGPPTVVAKGKTPEQHVNDYFTAYKEQRLEDAFDMSPAENKVKQPKNDFVTLRKGMPIAEYKVSVPQARGNTTIIQAEYSVGQYGTWISTWEFEKKGDDWIALRYKADPKQ